MQPYDHPYGRDLASLLANSAALQTLYRIMQQSTDPTGGIRNWLIWAVGILITYFLVGLTIRAEKARSLLPIPAVLPAIGILTGIYFFGDSPASILSWTGLAFFLGIVQVQIVEHLIKTATPESRLLDFETCTLILIVTVLLQTGGTLSSLDLIPPAIGSALSLIGLVWQRTCSGKNSGQIPTMIYTIALPGAALSILTLIFLSLSSILGKGLHTLILGITRLGHWILSGIYRAFLWLISLFPAGAQEILPDLAAESAPDMAAGTANLPDAGTILTPILILMIAGGLIGFFLIAKSSRLSLNRSGRGSSRSRKHISLRKALRIFLQRTIRRARRSLFCLLHPRAPQTQFIRLEDAMRRRHVPRTAGETPRSFLLRCTEHFPEKREDLSLLADTLDEIYFQT